jgi:hypothetical protein
MYTHPDRMGQLVTERHRELLADARRGQLRQQTRPAPGTPGATWTITRRLGMAIAKAGAAAARIPSAIWPARPQSLGETPVPR